MPQIDLNVVSYSVDHQDGSGSVTLFNNLEEFKFYLEDDERYERILNEEDPYGDGTIGEETIKISIENNVATLLNRPSFDFGQ